MARVARTGEESEMIRDPLPPTYDCNVYDVYDVQIPTHCIMRFRFWRLK